MTRPTPETDALAENLIPIVEKINEFNAQYVIKQILTEILTKTTKLERERDEAREQIKELIYIAERAIDLADIDFENDKFGVVSELRSDLEEIKEETK